MNSGRGNTINTNRSRFFVDRSPGLILAGAWLLVQGFLFYQNGIVTELEAVKYITEAHFLLDHGTLSSPNFWLYSVQIFLVAGAIKLHTGYISVVIVQLLFNALATYYLYRLFQKLSNGITAFCAILLFICNIPFQTFNDFLYTESLFYSFIILLTCYLLQLQKLTAGRFIRILLFLLLICFTRPTGLLFVPCTFLFLFARFFRNYSWLLKTGIAVVAAFAYLFILDIALDSGGELDFLLPFREEHIICGLPTVTNAGFVTGEGENSILGIFHYILQHPAQFGHLALLRTKVFFGLTRPYYSLGHNLYLGLYFFPVYLLALFGLKKWWLRNLPVLLYCSSLVLITWFSVLLTCDDWHNRFFLTLVPIIYIAALPALQQLLSKLNWKITNRPGI